MAGLDGIVCSPPFADSSHVNNTVMGESPGKAEWRGGGDSAGRMKRDYMVPDTPGQVGALKAEDYPVETTACEILEWQDCYNESWKGILPNEAFSHPAKYSRGLIVRILRFGIQQGYWKPGDVIGDPFAGVGCGGICAAYEGLGWGGVELEEKFYNLCQEGFRRHHRTWEALGAPQPRVVLGDSRRFAELVRGVEGIVTSPPFLATEGGCKVSGGEINEKLMSRHNATGNDRYGTTPGQVGQLKAGDVDAVVGEVAGIVTSPPYAESSLSLSPDAKVINNPAPAGSVRKYKRKAPCQEYGTTPGQVGALKAGDVAAVVGEVAGIVTSPPYAESIHSGYSGIDWSKREAGAVSKDSRLARTQDNIGEGYGTTPGQVGALKEGDVDAVVTSPPYEGLPVAPSVLQPGGRQGVRSSYRSVGEDADDHYGDSKGQVGTTSGETYWQAMRLIYEQCRLALKPNGVLCVVVKSYVKGGRLVDLPGQTTALLESLGFRVFLRVHALLTKTTREPGLFEPEVVKKKERKSFFRRLAERKGSPAIDYEEVIFARRPAEGLP